MPFLAGGLSYAEHIKNTAECECIKGEEMPIPCEIGTSITLLATCGSERNGTAQYINLFGGIHHGTHSLGEYRLPPLPPAQHVGQPDLGFYYPYPESSYQHAPRYDQHAYEYDQHTFWYDQHVPLYDQHAPLYDQHVPFASVSTGSSADILLGPKFTERVVNN
ncbi:hypothetical protein PILCRDRAFT_94075, partial [Piloderma croceum F 1598]